MDDCCQSKAGELAQLRERQANVLWIVLAINATMFVLELGAGLLAGSVALQADALDMLGDTFVYGFSLYALHKSDRWRAISATLKGGIMALFGVGVLVQCLGKLLTATPPVAPLMGGMSLIALAANATCLFLLTRHKSDDINMRSTWLCSRNDIIANTSVLGAALLVALTHSFWPDVIVSVMITALFLRSAWAVLYDARTELRRTQPARPLALCAAGICPSSACQCVAG